MATSIMDLVLFHAMEINLYNQLVHTMGADPVVTKQVLALWLWMESIGYPQLVHHIYTYNDNALKRVFAEGEACLKALHPDMDPADNNDIPITAGLAKEPINLRFFRYNRDAVIQGIANVLNNVCNVIFDENVTRMAKQDANYSTDDEAFLLGFMKSAGEGSSRQAMEAAGRGDNMPMAASYQAMDSPWGPDEMGLGMAPSLLSSLNPFANPWTPSNAEERLRKGYFEQDAEEQRSMFFTFSRGYPLAKEDVVEFFTS